MYDHIVRERRLDRPVARSHLVIDITETEVLDSGIIRAR